VIKVLSQANPSSFGILLRLDLFNKFLAI